MESNVALAYLSRASDASHRDGMSPGSCHGVIHSQIKENVPLAGEATVEIHQKTDTVKIVYAITDLESLPGPDARCSRQIGVIR